MKINKQEIEKERKIRRRRKKIRYDEEKEEIKRKKHKTRKRKEKNEWINNKNRKTEKKWRSISRKIKRIMTINNKTLTWQRTKEKSTLCFLWTFSTLLVLHYCKILNVLKCINDAFVFTFLHLVRLHKQLRLLFWLNAIM